MAIEESAHGAPRGKFTHSPTGFRRMTPGLLKADRMAEKFTGFPEGVTSHGQLLAAFKAARPRLGISTRLVDVIDYLFSFTRPQDWNPESRPIVWPSTEQQRIALGLQPTQLKEITRRLVELGFVTMKDSPNGKRYGKRFPDNETGHIVEAYGYDLSLFALRHAEFVRLASEARAERAAMGRLKRRKTIARKAIAQILETAKEYGFEDDEWQTLGLETRELVRTLTSVERLDEMEIGVKSLERRQQAARQRLEHLLGTVEIDPKQAENRPHIYNYNPPPNLNKDTVIATENCTGSGETLSSQGLASVPHGSNSQSVASGRQDRTDRGLVDRTSADEIARLVPKLREYLRRPDPNWSDIVDAADGLRSELGVSKSLWGEACVAMGRNRAAMALALITTKEPGQIKNPGGYFRRMLQKDNAGELHLDSSFWGLRHATNSDHRAGRKDRSDRAFGGDAQQGW